MKTGTPDWPTLGYSVYIRGSDEAVELVLLVNGRPFPESYWYDSQAEAEKVGQKWVAEGTIT